MAVSLCDSCNRFTACPECNQTIARGLQFSDLIDGYIHSLFMRSLIVSVVFPRCFCALTRMTKTTQVKKNGYNSALFKCLQIVEIRKKEGVNFVIFSAFCILETIYNKMLRTVHLTWLDL